MCGSGTDFWYWILKRWIVGSVWLYPPVLQIFAKYAAENDGYSDCGFGPTDVGDRFGVLDVGGVVPEGYRRLSDL